MQPLAGEGTPQRHGVARQPAVLVEPDQLGFALGEQLPLRLTELLGAKLAAVLRPLAKPRVDRVPDLDNAGAQPGGSRLVCSDERTYGQRRWSPATPAVLSRL